MGVRYRSATPGTLLCLAATILLAIVSFNTPLLKSLYFLSASYSSGQYAGTLKLGTLGYCLDENGSETCVGPTVGYEFNPNDLLGVTVFNIPETITKYLTYTLILHVVALGFAVLATIFGLLSHISTLSLLCFPTCMASLASTFSLIALIFDLVIFYIAKARIDAVSGASASVGICVWLTLAAWLLCGFAGCAYGIGRCCVGSRSRQESGDPKGGNQGYYGGNNGADEMRLHAIRDEQARKKEQGLPSFQELERTPLTNGDDGTEDKYLVDEERTMPGGLRRDGSVLQGVGMGYGRRTPANAYAAPYAPGLSRRQSGSTLAGPGAAGVGAGGVGVEQPEPAYNYYDQGQQQDYYGHGYTDPYAQRSPQQSYSDPYQQGYSDQYGASQPQQQQYGEHNYRTTPSPMPMPVASGQPAHGYGNGKAGYSGAASSESYDPGPRVSQASHDAYDGYDDGLGAIGMAAQTGAGRHERDYTGQTFGGVDHQGYSNNQIYGNQNQNQNQIHAPAPQHLVNPHGGNNLLRSPMSPGSDVGGQRNMVVGHQLAPHDEHDGDDTASGRPPSYGAVAGGYTTQVMPEKSGYAR